MCGWELKGEIVCIRLMGLCSNGTPCISLWVCAPTSHCISAHHEHVLLSVTELHVEDGGVSRVFSCQIQVGDLRLTLGLEGCMWR